MKKNIIDLKGKNIKDILRNNLVAGIPKGHLRSLNATYNAKVPEVNEEKFLNIYSEGKVKFEKIYGIKLSKIDLNNSNILSSVPLIGINIEGPCLGEFYLHDVLIGNKEDFVFAVYESIIELNYIGHFKSALKEFDNIEYLEYSTLDKSNRVILKSGDFVFVIDSKGTIKGRLIDNFELFNGNIVVNTLYTNDDGIIINGTKQHIETIVGKIVYINNG